MKMSDLQDMICSLEKEATFAGLKINGGKTKLLSLTGSISRNVKVAGVRIEEVDRWEVGTNIDIENRINKARAAFGMLLVVWRNKNFSTSLAFQVKRSVRSAIWLLYMKGLKKLSHRDCKFSSIAA